MTPNVNNQTPGFPSTTDEICAESSQHSTQKITAEIKAYTYSAFLIQQY